MKPLFAAWVMLVLVFAGCSMLQIGKDLGEGLGSGIQGEADTIGSSVVRGMRDTLTSVQTQRQLDSLLTGLGRVLADQARRTRDTLFGNATSAWVERLRDSLMGARTREQLAAIRNELIGTATRSHLAALRTELLGDSTQRLVGAVRNQLLGSDTKAEIASIIDTAMVHVAMQFGTNLKPLLQQELSFVQKNATLLLIILAVIACGVIAFVFMEKRRTLQLLQTLTFQIHQIPDQNAYDELVRRIQRSAQETGLEPQLRKILDRQGILGKDAWRTAA